MKKALVAMAIAFVLIGAVSAQPWVQNTQPWSASPRMGQGNTPGLGQGYGMHVQAATIAFEKISLEGTLALIDTRVAIQKDGKTYFVMIPDRIFGFVDGLKEGANVKIEGYSREIPGLKDNFVVHVDTLTVNGRTIDLSKTAGSAGPMGGTMMNNGMMGGSRMGGGYGTRGNSMPMGRWYH
jgi:hypothetical protein